MQNNNLPNKLVKAINNLLFSNPFFASIILQRKVIIDNSNDTAWTDGESIAFSEKFIEENSIDILKFTLAHEVLHITNLHHTRMQNKNHDLWNQACDYAINLILKDAGFALWPNCLINESYRDKSAEDIYRILNQNPQNNKNNKNNQNQNNSGNKNGQNNAQSGQSNNQNNNSGGSNNQSGQGNQKSFGEVRPCKAGEESKIEEETKVQVKQAINNAKSQGKLPGFIDRMIKNIPSNKDWKEALAQFASVVSNNDYSFNKVNTRYSQTGFIFPGLYSKEVGNIIVSCDTSGSVTEKEISIMVSELMGILENLEETNKDNIEVPVIYCDSVVQKVEFLSSGDVSKPKGGGGTDFKPPFEYIEKNLNTPAGMVYITDGYCDSFPENPGYPVLWALFVNNPTFKPPFGEVVYISPGSY